MDDPVLDVLKLALTMTEKEQEILRQYAIKLKAAYAAKVKVDDNG